MIDWLDLRESYQLSMSGQESSDILQPVLLLMLMLLIIVLFHMRINILYDTE
jgi:hypothetical protein